MATARQKRQKKREGKLDVALAKGERKAGTKKRVTEKEAFKPKKKDTPETIKLGSRSKESLKKSEKKAKLTKTLTKTATGLGVGLAALTGVGLATGALGAGAAVAGTGARVAAGAGGRAVVSGSVSAHKLTTTAAGAEKLIGIGTRTAARNFVGRPAVSNVNKLFQAGGKFQSSARFATNAKSGALTKSFMLKLGLTLGGASLAKDIIGTYPFASFLKEEAVQSVGLPLNKALNAGDIEGAQTLLDKSNEIVNKDKEIVDSIPYANVQKSVAEYMDAQRAANVQWQRLIDQQVAELSGEQQTLFAKQQEITGEDKRQRELEQRGRDAEYFALIREGKYDEAEELLQSELAGGTDNDR